MESGEWRESSNTLPSQLSPLNSQLFSMKVSTFILFFSLMKLTGLIAQEDTVKQIERACPSVFNIVLNEKTYSLRYASNHALTEKNKNIKQLVIYIHGARRNGLDYYDWGEQAVKTANKDAETLFISPQFASEKDLQDHKQDATHLFWSNNNWRSGDESVTGKKRTMTDFISSFSVIDSIIARVCNSKLFPKLKKVTVIGHSAGGQFVERYACMTPMPNVLAKFKFRFIVMNPSTYLYFDDRRPIKTATGLTFSKPDTLGCISFNEYPRGAEKLNPYAAKIGMSVISQQFFKRDIVFILGGSDNDMNDSSMDKSCGGNLQGRFRLERGKFFYEYIQLVAKEMSSTKTGKVHRLEVVPNVAHSGEKMINNDIAKKYLFE